MWVFCKATFGAVLVFALLQPSGAHAAPGDLRDARPHDRPQMLSVFTGFHLDHRHGSGLPVSVSGRYYYPIVPDGFGRTINDEFGIEGGIDLLFRFGGGDMGIGVPVAGMYDLHLSERFDAYAKAGFSVHFNHGARAFPYAAVGMRFKLNDTLYFRAEAGYPLLMAGLGFAL